MSEGRIPRDFGREFEPRRPLRSFYETAVEVAFSPHAFYARIPRIGDYFTPALFVMVCAFVSYALSGIYYDFYLAFNPSVYALSVLVAPFTEVLLCLLGAVFIHPLFVRLTQGLGNAGFEATFRVMCYASVVLLVDWAFAEGPGFILYAFLTFYLIMVGLRQMHQMSTATATFLTLFPLLPAIIGISVVGSIIVRVANEDFLRGAERLLELLSLL